MIIAACRAVPAGPPWEALQRAERLAKERAVAASARLDPRELDAQRLLLRETAIRHALGEMDT